MCMLCVEIQRGQMTAKEIARAYDEMQDLSPEHWIEVLAEIQRDDKFQDVALELAKLHNDRLWD